MPYVQRDEEGNIIAVYNDEYEGLELVPPDDEQLEAFLYAQHEDEKTKKDWMESDLQIARVTEDLIDILIEKGVILFQDFPEGAQKKLLSRQGLRKEFAYVETLFGNNQEETGYDINDEEGGGGIL